MRAVDLKQEVYELLKKASPASAQNWNSLFTHQVASEPFHVQVEHVNSFWRVQLGLLSESTINEREYLMNGLTVDQWLLRFERYVIPTIARHNLPRRIQ